MSLAESRVLALLAERGANKTVCPSEVARTLASGGEWRGEMPRVHRAVDALHAQGLLMLSWKGKIMAQRAGPYRIALTAT